MRARSWQLVGGGLVLVGLAFLGCSSTADTSMGTGGSRDASVDGVDASSTGTVATPSGGGGKAPSTSGQSSGSAGGNGGASETGSASAAGGASGSGASSSSVTVSSSVAVSSSTSTGSTGGGGGTAPVKVWIAGDSTVQNCSTACPCGWGGQFDALFNPNVTVVNSAVGGRSIQTWLYEGNVGGALGANGECTLTSQAYNARWTAMLNATSGMKAGDYLFIQFGINDSDATCPRHVGLTLFKTYLGAMAKAAKDRGAHPIFVTPVSAISCSGAKAVGTRGAFVTATKDAGVANDVPVIDLHQLSVNLYNSLGFCPNNSDYTTGIVGAFFCDDHTHFESAGAQKIAGLVAKALADQGVPLSAYLK